MATQWSRRDAFCRAPWHLAFAVVLLPLLACIGCGPAVDSAPAFHPSTPAQAAALAYYIGTVKPILQSNCQQCHYGMNHKGGFNLSTRALVLRGGNHGPAVIPGDPDHSLLLVVLRHQGPADHPMPMPKKGEKLPDKDIAAVAQWVTQGAIMDR